MVRNHSYQIVFGMFHIRLEAMATKKLVAKPTTRILQGRNQMNSTTWSYEALIGTPISAVKWWAVALGVLVALLPPLACNHADGSGHYVLEQVSTHSQAGGHQVRLFFAAFQPYRNRVLARTWVLASRSDFSRMRIACNLVE